MLTKQNLLSRFEFRVTSRIIGLLVMKTPLFDTHRKLGARMAPFAGWQMPIQYEGILREHEYTRTHASLFDICHMGEFDIEGPTAASDLDKLLTQSVSTMKAGQCRYGYLLNEDGGVLDDLICYRRGPAHFWLVVNAGTKQSDAAWIKKHLSAQTEFTDISGAIAKLDIQGPASRAEMEAAFGTTLPDLAYFRFADINIMEVPCTLSRTGYTGEWGYELYMPFHAAAEFWQMLLERSRIKPAGLGARDTLRLEMGYPLYGQELTPARTPVAAGGKPFLALDTEFTGHKAVQADLENGTPERLVGLRLDGKQAARAGDWVLCDKKKAGVVTSGSLSPSLGVAVALAYVNSDLATSGRTLGLDVRGKSLTATVVDLPFYRGGTVGRKS